MDARNTYFDIRKAYVRLEDILYKRFDIQKGFVTIVDVLYTLFKTRWNYVRVVDIRLTSGNAVCGCEKCCTRVLTSRKDI